MKAAATLISLALAVLPCLVQAQAPSEYELEQRAYQRKMITLGMHRSDVVGRIGEPDSQRVEMIETPSGTRLPGQTSDVYLPRRGDEETRTTIRYENDVVVNVHRMLTR